jgi:hypothetical protein
MPDISFQDESTECAICLEPLEDGRVLTLQCGHRWHYDCLVQQLQTVQSMTSNGHGRRLIFTGCQCAKCGHICCEHAELEHLTRATDVLRRKVDVLLEEQLQSDVPDVWKKAVKENADSSARQALIDEARRKYAFYLCSHCKEPYFGGTVECADEVGQDDDTSSTSNGTRTPEQRLCVACSPQSQVICQNPLEHGPYLVWKCRYCCKPSTHVCYGNVHFCDHCHDRNSKRHREIQRQQHSGGLARTGEVKPPPLEAIPCPGESCRYPKPNNQRHCNGPSPTDCEQVYSCVFCESNGSRGYHSMEPGSHNLLVNSSGQLGLHGWHQLNPRMSWTVEESELPVNANTATNFVSSFQDCIMMQRVNLLELLQETTADRVEPIRLEVSSRYMARTDCPSVFRMQAAVGWSRTAQNTSLDPRHILDQKITDLFEAPPDYWERASLQLQLDPSCLRAVPQPPSGRQLGLYVAVMGKDRRFWQGNFGSKVAEISARVLGSQEQLESILTPAALAQYHQQQHEEHQDWTAGEPPQQQQQHHVNTSRGTDDSQGQSHANFHMGGNSQKMTHRMLWDFLVPIVCFLLFGWLAMDGGGSHDNNHGRPTYKNNVH